MEQGTEKVTPEKRKRNTPLHIAFFVAFLTLCFSLFFLINDILKRSPQPTVKPTLTSSNVSVSISSDQIARELENLEVYSAADAPITFQGGGNKTTDAFTLPSIFTRAIFTHTGRGSFTVTASFNEDEHRIIEAFGDYQGSILVKSSSPVSFEIQTDGSWSATLEGVGKSDSAAFSGTGDDVSGFFISLGKSEWSFSHTGKDRFIVRYHCLGGSELVVNQFGDYTGSSMVHFDDGPCLWEVKSNGSWKIKPK